MPEFQAFVCDGVTGALVERVQVDSFTWERLLSAGGDGQVSFPITGEYTKTQLRDLTRHWSRIWALAYGDELLYLGYVVQRGYTLGGDAIALKLKDLWGMFPRRGAWDHGAANVEKWKTTVSGNLAMQAARAIERGRDTGPALPAMGMPLTLPGGYPGPSVSRTYYGYNVETIDDVIATLLDEGLDIYFKPRLIGNGDVDWIYRAGTAWASGVVHEVYPNAAESVIAGFVESGDGLRVTNNARRIGEGSEEDMLVRSNRNTASSYPLLDRVTSVKTVSDVGQLAALANQDLVQYAEPTFEWSFDAPLSEGIDVGDTVRFCFDGDPWIADGWHERRVVRVSGDDSSEFVTVTCQPTGGA